MAGLAPAEAMGARELALRISDPKWGRPFLIRVLTNRTELTVRPPGRPRPGPGPLPAPSGRPAKLGPVGRQPPACAGRAQNLVSAGF